MKMIPHIKFLFGSLLLSVVLSCNPEEQEPAYVTFEGFNLTVDSGEGSASADINNVWVFANNVYLGTYDLPARIPMLLSGPTTLRFEAGVRENGLSFTPQIYPFYQSVTREVELVPGNTVNIGRQNIGYRSEAIFGFVEGFEPNRPRVFTEVVVGEGPIELTNQNIFEGDASGLIRLTDSFSVAEVLSEVDFSDLFDQGVEPRLWLEMDFLSEVQGLVGIVGPGDLGEIVRAYNPGFLPRDEWTKIYFNLSEVYFESRVTEFRVGISVVLPEGETEANVYFDNIKLVYR